MRPDGEPVVILLKRGSNSCMEILHWSLSLAECQHSMEQDDWSQQMTMVHTEWLLLSVVDVCYRAPRTGTIVMASGRTWVCKV